MANRSSRHGAATLGLTCLALGLPGCVGRPAPTNITFVVPQTPVATTAHANTLGAGWAGSATISQPATFLALGAGDRLGTMVRQNDYILAMGLNPNQGNTRLADVPVTTE